MNDEHGHFSIRIGTFLIRMSHLGMHKTWDYDNAPIGVACGNLGKMSSLAMLIDLQSVTGILLFHKSCRKYHNVERSRGKHDIVAPLLPGLRRPLHSPIR